MALKSLVRALKRLEGRSIHLAWTREIVTPPLKRCLEEPAYVLNIRENNLEFSIQDEAVWT